MVVDDVAVTCQPGPIAVVHVVRFPDTRLDLVTYVPCAGTLWTDQGPYWLTSRGLRLQVSCLQVSWWYSYLDLKNSLVEVLAICV